MISAITLHSKNNIALFIILTLSSFYTNAVITKYYNIDGLAPDLEVKFNEADPCSICQDSFNDPQVLPCGHSFCRECIEDAEQRKKECPTCRKRYRVDDRTPNYALRDAVAISSGKCPLCNGNFSDEDMESHLKSHTNDYLTPEQREEIKQKAMTESIASTLAQLSLHSQKNSQQEQAFTSLSDDTAYSMPDQEEVLSPQAAEEKYQGICLYVENANNWGMLSHSQKAIDLSTGKERMAGFSYELENSTNKWLPNIQFTLQVTPFPQPYKPGSPLTFSSSMPTTGKDPALSPKDAQYLGSAIARSLGRSTQEEHIIADINRQRIETYHLVSYQKMSDPYTLEVVLDEELITALSDRACQPIRFLMAYHAQLPDGTQYTSYQTIKAAETTTLKQQKIQLELDPAGHILESTHLTHQQEQQIGLALQAAPRKSIHNTVHFFITIIAIRQNEIPCLNDTNYVHGAYAQRISTFSPDRIGSRIQTDSGRPVAHGNFCFTTSREGQSTPSIQNSRWDDIDRYNVADGMASSRSIETDSIRPTPKTTPATDQKQSKITTHMTCKMKSLSPCIRKLQEETVIGQCCSVGTGVIIHLETILQTRDCTPESVLEEMFTLHETQSQQAFSFASKRKESKDSDNSADTY